MEPVYLIVVIYQGKLIFFLKSPTTQTNQIFFIPESTNLIQKHVENVTLNVQIHVEGQVPTIVQNVLMLKMVISVYQNVLKHHIMMMVFVVHVIQIVLDVLDQKIQSELMVVLPVTWL